MESSGKENLTFIFDSPVPRTEVAELVVNEFLVIKEKKKSTPLPNYLGPRGRWHAQALENSFLLSIRIFAALICLCTSSTFF